VKVICNGIAAPVVFALESQVAVILPWSISLGEAATLIVEVDGVRSAPFRVPVAASRFGLFSLDSSGKGTVAALNQDGSIHGEGRRAKAGEVIVLFGSGGGAMNPPGLDGRLAQGVSKYEEGIRVWIGEVEAETLYAGNAPGMVEGVGQLNIRISRDTPLGAQTVRLEQGGRRWEQGVVIWVE
jgi:uncharacterized protein (TIGR03437 family)